MLVKILIVLILINIFIKIYNSRDASRSCAFSEQLGSPLRRETLTVRAIEKNIEFDEIVELGE